MARKGGANSRVARTYPPGWLCQPPLGPCGCGRQQRNRKGHYVTPPKRERRISKSIRQEVIARDLTSKGLKWDPERYHIDHVVPFSRGGDHSTRNLRVIERTKNLRKGGKMPGFGIFSRSECWLSWCDFAPLSGTISLYANSTACRSRRRRRRQRHEKNTQKTGRFEVHNQKR